MPYLNAEVTLYQIGNDGTYAYQGDPKESVFRANMEVLMGGGYFTYYYSIQAWDVVRWNETPNGITWYKNVGTFMKTTGWYNMAPDDALIGGGGIGKHCLANPGKEYIVYDSGGGGFSLSVAGAAGPLKATWVDLYTGMQSALPNQSNGSNAFANPWPGPALLHLAPWWINRPVAPSKPGLRFDHAGHGAPLGLASGPGSWSRKAGRLMPG